MGRAWISPASPISISLRFPFNFTLQLRLNGIWISVVRSCLISLPLAMSVWCDNPQELINKPLTNKLELSPCTHSIALWLGGGWLGGWLSVVTGLRANVRAAGKPLSRTHQQRQSGPTLTWLSANISKQKRKVHSNTSLLGFFLEQWHKSFNVVEQFARIETFLHFLIMK